MKYLLRCVDWNEGYVSFILFDEKKTHCGRIVVLASDALNFIQNSWNGDLDWNGFLPEMAIKHPEKFGSNQERK